MSYAKADLKRTHHALKVLKDGFKKAERLHEARQADNASFTAEIRQRYPEGRYDRDFYESAIRPKIKAEVDAHNAKNRQDFLDGMGETPSEMLEAIRTLREAQDFKTQALDFSDPTLINALHMLDAYGKNMPYEEQRNLCLTFAGDMPALKAIENGMKKNGMVYHEIAHRLQASVDGAFLDEAETIVYGMFPEVAGAYKGHAYREWINREINEKAEIYGLDLSVDPYREALRKDAKITTGSWREQERQFNAHKLIATWEKELQDMESRGETEQANRSARQIYDVLAEDGIKLRE